MPGCAAASFAERLDPRDAGHRVGGTRHDDDPAAAVERAEQVAGDLLPEARVVRSDIGDAAGVRPGRQRVHESGDRNARGRDASNCRVHARRVHRREHERVRRLGQGPVDQRALLLRIVAFLRNVVDRLRAERARRPVRAEPRCLVGRIRQVLGEDGELQTMPPLGCTIWPCTHEALSEARKATTSATSCGRPTRLNGESAADRAFISSVLPAR